ncbi:12761_t:CDS:2 [Cetraspora pellucida]|uniref:12761_t:CDS:1 n=1 Tax=Cetraspora pellucida TaxID=1433469 RepID=A0A9N8ZYD0_9GLOM|nr:12761_t:CDS:2 [Cetraspora pellucida]
MSKATEIMQNLFFEDIFEVQGQEDTPLDEFPILSLLAHKYLCIPATSVPCERLFSDAGNLITPQHTRLSSKTIGKILFFKRNAEHLSRFKNYV